MEPSVLGQKYDKVAQWWHDHHVDSQYGVTQLLRALNFCARPGAALDVGCGAGGRFVRILQQRGFAITGVDVSAQMIKLARQNHPTEIFYLEDIGSWQSVRQFDLIIAWDSIFHLPQSMQAPVLAKLCGLLAAGGVLVYTLGDACGEHDDQWEWEPGQVDRFHYSSIGVNGNLQVLGDNGVECKHLELDQWPQNHVYVIGVKNGAGGD